MQELMFKKGDKVTYIADDQDTETEANIGDEYIIDETSLECPEYLLRPVGADCALSSGWCTDHQIELTND